MTRVKLLKITSVIYSAGVMYNNFQSKCNVFQETTCTEKDGWCIKDMTDQCRDIMYKYTERLLSTDDTVQQSFAKRKFFIALGAFLSAENY